MDKGQRQEQRICPGRQWPEANGRVIVRGGAVRRIDNECVSRKLRSRGTGSRVAEQRAAESLTLETKVNRQTSHQSRGNRGIARQSARYVVRQISYRDRGGRQCVESGN